MFNRLARLFRSELAVDLGTTNTRLCTTGQGLVLSEPSVVAIDESTGKILSGGCAVGHLARLMHGRTPQSISVVRPLREGAIANFQLCEAMLRYFFRKAQQRRTMLWPRVVIAAPGCITSVEKRAIYNSAQRAGAGEVLLLSEAKAAAIGAGLPLAEPVGSMICDIGGGTTDVAVMSLGEVVAQTSIRLGGDCFDQAIVEYLKQHYSLIISQAAAERLRIDIGCAHSQCEQRADEVSGVDTISGLPRKATLSSEELRQALEPALTKIVNSVKQTIDQCSSDLAGDLVDQGMTLVGGCAMQRGMDRYLAEQTSIPVRIAPDPLSAVANGALICLEHLSQWRSVLQSSDQEI